jgi:hypothetical protein
VLSAKFFFQSLFAITYENFEEMTEAVDPGTTGEELTLNPLGCLLLLVRSGYRGEAYSFLAHLWVKTLPLLLFSHASDFDIFSSLFPLHTLSKIFFSCR